MPQNPGDRFDVRVHGDISGQVVVGNNNVVHNTPARASAGPDTTNAISGTVSGHSTQVGSVHGDMHLHQAPATPGLPVPRQLLAPPPRFAGRADELDQLDRVLRLRRHDPAPVLVALTGPPGAGKTALALRWLHEVADRFPDGQLYADLGDSHGGTAVEAGDVLGMFLRALGVASERVPAHVDERAALYRSATARKSLAVLIDDAQTWEQVRSLLSGAPESLTIVTSRNRLMPPANTYLMDLKSDEALNQS